MRDQRSISILGCGWLGFPLAKKLISQKHLVKGSTTNSEKLLLFSENGIEPYLLNLNNLQDETLSNFLKSDILIIAIPSSAVKPENLTRILIEASKSEIKQIILISSTGVYNDSNSEISEDDLNFIQFESPIYKTEELVKSFKNLNSVILRMAGLIGYDRQPLHYGKSPKVKTNPNGRVNMIHQDDAVRAIVKIIESAIKNETFNCCADQHPTKKEFYTRLAKINNTEIPVFDDVSNDSFKIISNQKVKQTLNFEFMDLYEGLH